MTEQEIKEELERQFQEEKAALITHLNTPISPEETIIDDLQFHVLNLFMYSPETIEDHKDQTIVALLRALTHAMGESLFAMDVRHTLGVELRRLREEGIDWPELIAIQRSFDTLRNW